MAQASCTELTLLECSINNLDVKRFGSTSIKLNKNGSNRLKLVQMESNCMYLDNIFIPSIRAMQETHIGNCQVGSFSKVQSGQKN